MRLKDALAILVVTFQVNLSCAGEYALDKDEFAGTSRTSYQSTESEAREQGITWVIRDYNKSDDTVWIGMMASSGLATSCDKHYVLFKDSAGEIHQADFEEKNLRMCIGRVPVKWVAPVLFIRLPMHEGRQDGKFNNSNFDPTRLD